MTKPKFKKDDRIIYVGGMNPLHGKVLMPNGAVPSQVPSYDIQIDGQPDVYTVGEKALRPLMSDHYLAKNITTALDRAYGHIQEARSALKMARQGMEVDGQPDYQLTMLDEWDIVLKNALRYELSTETSRWRDIAVERKKGK